MSDTKFTPGAWLDCYDYDELDGYWICAKKDDDDLIPVCILEEKVNIFDGDSEQKPTAEMNANANLIAAAPEMYAALKGLLDAYTQSDESYCDCREDHGEGFPCPACIGRAALAKARGEQP